MKNQTPKLTKAEIAALDFLIEETRDQGGTMAWPGAAAAAVGRAVGAAVAAEAVSRVADAVLGANASIDSLTDDQTSELMQNLKSSATQDTLTLEQLIELRNKVQ